MSHDALFLVLPQSSLTTWVQTYKKSTVGPSRVGLFQGMWQKYRPQNPTRELARFLLIWWPSHDNKTKGVWTTGDWWMGRKESREQITRWESWTTVVIRVAGKPCLRNGGGHWNRKFWRWRSFARWHFSLWLRKKIAEEMNMLWNKRKWSHWEPGLE